jgi:F0F1-type ATP synthase epsilon subunit
MAEKAIRCKVITRQERVLDAQVTYVSVPLWDGKAGFMSHTAPFVAKMGAGELRVEMASGGTKSWFVDSGFVQNVGDVLTVLTAQAIPAELLNAAEAKAELAEASARRSEDPVEMARITKDRDRARAKVAMATAK